jgi:hypothetical protein
MLVWSLRAITKLEISLKHQPPEPPFGLDQWTRPKFLCFGFLDMSVFYKNERDLPHIPGPDKCHNQVEPQLFAEWRNVSTILRQSCLVFRLEW